MAVEVASKIGRAPGGRKRSPADDGLDALRAEWRRQVGERLPTVARLHPEWPIRLDHCFARVILDAVCGRPWREVLPAPAWRHLDADGLRRALALADAIADGDVDLAMLNRRSLQMRGKRRSSGAGRSARHAPAAGLFDDADGGGDG